MGDNILMECLLEQMAENPGSLDRHVIASGANMALARIRALEQHLGRVLHLYSGAWHPNSIAQQEWGHEIQAARDFLYGPPKPVGGTEARETDR